MRGWSCGSQPIGRDRFGNRWWRSIAAPPPHDTPVTHRWWFWTAIVGTALAAGAAAYYATGDPRLVAPSGSVGTLDRR